MSWTVRDSLQLLIKDNLAKGLKDLPSEALENKVNAIRNADPDFSQSFQLPSDPLGLFAHNCRLINLIHKKDEHARAQQIGRAHEKYCQTIARQSSFKIDRETKYQQYRSDVLFTNKKTETLNYFHNPFNQTAVNFDRIHGMCDDLKQLERNNTLLDSEELKTSITAAKSMIGDLSEKRIVAKKAEKIRNNIRWVQVRKKLIYLLPLTPIFLIAQLFMKKKVEKYDEQIKGLDSNIVGKIQKLGRIPEIRLKEEADWKHEHYAELQSKFDGAYKAPANINKLNQDPQIKVQALIHKIALDYKQLRLMSAPTENEVILRAGILLSIEELKELDDGIAMDAVMQQIAEDVANEHMLENESEFYEHTDFLENRSSYIVMRDASTQYQEYQRNLQEGSIKLKNAIQIPDGCEGWQDGEIIEQHINEELAKIQVKYKNCRKENESEPINKQALEPLAKLHQSSRRQSSCLTNAVIF